MKFKISGIRFFVLFIAFCFFTQLVANPVDEKTKIKLLIDKVETCNCKFIRNGSEHSPKDAKSHLELKLSKAGSRIKTAEQFIQYLATKSSFTGRPYYILENGKKIPSATWLKEKLKEIENKK
ncbi:MAG: DUF5329 domain-containing protein [Leptospiraceae bacterium]|nr:DUF5329 domain-containing protein [Leptospiraceae bacterium]MCP5497364.1 DUF5329 domain-containing protein [Leptospiraceae bacterium]